MSENIFNQMAKRYDSAERIELANTIAAEIRRHLPAAEIGTLLDYGSGTGLVGLQFKDDFKHLIFSDISGEMLKVVDAKIKAGKIKNAETKSPESVINNEADVIIVSLVMIHVPEYKQLINQLYKLLKDKGQLLIADFDKNENIYHEKVHNGFTHDEMQSALEDAGFNNVDIKTFYHGEKVFMKKDASMFIASAKK